MLHLTAHARPGTFLFTTWVEGLALWERLLTLEPVALCLMPDHVHLLAQRYDRARLVGALSGYTRWLGHRRGTPGLRLWLPHPPPEVLPDKLHLQRSWRYVHLNPCRDKLASDPLAWPASTHRDACGVALPPACGRARDPAAFHRYVSGDPSVRPEGSPLPAPAVERGRPSLPQVVAAVSALTRTPVDTLPRAVGPRRLLVAAAVRLLGLRTGELAATLGLHPGTLRADLRRDPPDLSLVTRVLGDARFAPLDDRPLDQLPAWRAYMADQPYRRRLERLPYRSGSHGCRS
ncbi:MAG: hypothetical protein ABIO70_06810 [Pseudomonadota bacterium]